MNIIRMRNQATVSRRNIVRAGAAMGVATGVGLKASGVAGKQESTLSGTIVVPVAGGSWGDAYQENMIDTFHAMHPDVEVKTEMSGDSERLLKLRAAGGENPPLDVVGLTNEFMDAAIREGLVDTFTAEEIPNAEKLYEISTPEYWRDGDSYYAVHQNWGQLGFAYRTDLVENPPKEWLDIFDSQYESQFGFGPLTYSAALQFFIAVIRSMGGHESNPEDVDAAFTKLEELKPNVAAAPADSGALQSLLERGEIAIAHIWDGRAFALAEAGQPIGFVYPSDPGPVASGAPRGIAVGTPNRELAMAFLNHTLSVEAQEGFCNQMWYGPSNVDAKLQPEVDEKVAYGDEAYGKLWEPDYEAVSTELGEWQQRWTRTFSG